MRVVADNYSKPIPSGPFVAVFVERRNDQPSDDIQRLFLALADNTA